MDHCRCCDLYCVWFYPALVLNNKFRFRKAVRAIIVFPWATSLIIQAGVWKFIIDKDYGALNTLLMKIGLISSPVNWTPTPGAYFAWEIFVGIFVTVPFVTFCVLSGLQSIDNSYYEAATVDGANYWQKLFKITLPLVKSSLTVSTVFEYYLMYSTPSQLSGPLPRVIRQAVPIPLLHTFIN